MALKPVGGDPRFYDRIIHNPDVYGPFWLIVTWWLLLFISMAINSMIKNSFKTANIDMKKFKYSLELFFWFAVGAPLFLCSVLKCFGVNIMYSKSLCIYGYA